MGCKNFLAFLIKKMTFNRGVSFKQHYASLFHTNKVNEFTNQRTLKNSQIYDIIKKVYSSDYLFYNIFDNNSYKEKFLKQ